MLKPPSVRLKTQICWERTELLRTGRYRLFTTGLYRGSRQKNSDPSFPRRREFSASSFPRRRESSEDIASDQRAHVRCSSYRQSHNLTQCNERPTGGSSVHESNFWSRSCVSLPRVAALCGHPGKATSRQPFPRRQHAGAGGARPDFPEPEPRYGSNGMWDEPKAGRSGKSDVRSHSCVRELLTIQCCRQ